MKKKKEKMVVSCNECNKEIDDTVYKCDACGKPFCSSCSEDHCCSEFSEGNVEECVECGNPLSDGYFQCEECSGRACSEECIKTHWIDQHQEFSEFEVEDYIANEMVDAL